MQVNIILLLFKKFQESSRKFIIDMKNSIRLIIINIFMLIATMGYSQQECKVLKQGISDHYEGKCKNSFANGKGIATGIDRYEGQFINGLPQGSGSYTWSDGSTYTGEWLEGLRHGIGKYTIRKNGKDSIQNGLWLNDKYQGAKPDKPNVTYNYGVERYNFKKTLSRSNKVLIDIFQNGVRNNKITSLLMSTSSGEDITYGILAGYDNVIFPVTIKISYTTTNKLKTSLIYVKFDFVIYEPGDWKVELYN